MDESEILARIRLQKTDWETNVSTTKLEIEADIALIRWKKKKGKEELIWDFSMSSKVRNLVARSYRNKTPIHIRSTQNGSERIAKAQNKLYKEDRDTPLSKAIRYYKEVDKYTTWVAILAKVWWDGKKKAPIWTRINPLLAVPDSYWDYFTGDYRYIGFYSVKTRDEMESLWWSIEASQDSVNGEKQVKMDEQTKAWVIPQIDKEIFDIYQHFEYQEDGSVMLFITNGDCTHLHAKKKLKEMPFAFFYWEPNGTFFGVRPADFIRDTQKWKAEMRNLQADKVRQEVYTQWLYNSDYVSGKDIGFGLNKKIPIKSGLDGANIPLSNIVTPIQRDVRIDGTNAFIMELEQDVNNALALWEIAQGSTPDRRETAKTNSLVMDATDIILSLNEEMDAIGEQQYVMLWYSAYYENFTQADKKVIYAGSSTGQSSVVITRKDFIIDGNLSLQVETSQERETRLQKETAWRTQNSPMILQDPEINQSSKRIVLRKLLLAWGADMEDVEEEIPMTAQYLLQQEENTILKRWEWIDINPDDNDDEHLVSMWDINPDDVMMVAHQAAHIQSKISKSKDQVMQWQNQMLNGAMSQAMSQAWSQISKLNQQ